tara:strand:+ start:503 stop:754 length:252 start_codon:yes stop_codon:yes gene_type:complete
MEKKENPKTNKTLVTSAAAKVSEIFDGWKNVVFPNEHVEQIAKARVAICGECEFNVKSRCAKCGCPLVAKTRSMKSHCPLNKW